MRSTLSPFSRITKWPTPSCPLPHPLLPVHQHIFSTQSKSENKQIKLFVHQKKQEKKTKKINKSLSQHDSSAFNSNHPLIWVFCQFKQASSNGGDNKNNNVSNKWIIDSLFVNVLCLFYIPTLFDLILAGGRYSMMPPHPLYFWFSLSCAFFHSL